MEKKTDSAMKRRTRRIIQQSFIYLMQQMAFKEITIKILCEEADINRATFYRYYPDLYTLQDELSNELFDLMFTNVASHCDNPESNEQVSVYQYIYEALSVVENNLPLCSILLCDSNNITFSNRLYEAFKDIFYQHTLKQYQLQNEVDLLFQYMANGLIGTLRTWINSNCTVDKETLSHILDTSIMNTYALMEQFK